MNIIEIRNKLFDKLKGTGWDDKLRFFIKSVEFEEILEALEAEAEYKFRFTPGLQNLFKAFELCPLDTVKVVFVYGEPYPNPMINQGLAISNTAQGKEIPKKAQKFLNELKRQYPKTTIKECDLTPWCSQGVLLLNQSMTARISSEKRHVDFWAPFYYFILDVLKEINPIFVFIGTEPEDDFDHIELEDMPEAYNKEWNSQDVFLKVNEMLKVKKLPQIVW